MASYRFRSLEQFPQTLREMGLLVIAVSIVVLHKLTQEKPEARPIDSFVDYRASRLEKG